MNLVEVLFGMCFNFMFIFEDNVGYQTWRRDYRKSLGQLNTRQDLCATNKISTLFHSLIFLMIRDIQHLDHFLTPKSKMFQYFDIALVYKLLKTCGQS